ncbi:hypothetical protein THIOSC15_1400006 [uncultured Thiomicrorhabdus sp.]
MIELTDTQEAMFVNEMLDIEDVNDFLSMLTLKQLSHLVESYNASLVEWNTFNADDESTWPNDYGNYLINGESGVEIDYFNLEMAIDEGEWFVQNVTHWAYLPTVKEK